MHIYFYIKYSEQKIFLTERQLHFIQTVQDNDIFIDMKV